MGNKNTVGKKSMNPKVSSLKRSIKLADLQTYSIPKRGDTQITKIRNKREDITTKLMEVKKNYMEIL